jgi:hypothetical protein
MKKTNPITLMKHRTCFLPSGVAFLLAAIFPVFILAGQAQAQVTYALTNLFAEPAGSGSLFASSTASRGMAYDAVSNLVYVSANASPYLSAFNGTNGIYLGNFTTTGLSGGTYLIDQVGVAADGAIYAIDLATSSSSANKIYRWSNWVASAYTTAYNGNALANGTSLSYTSGRIGDTMQVTGSGTNTLILCGVAAKPYFVLFSTTDGLNFTSTIINVASGYSLSANIFGFCFYTNNTILAKPAGSGSSTLYLIQYPTNFASQTVVTGTVLASTSLGAAYNNTTMLNYVPSAGFLAAVQTGNNPMPVGLFNASNIAGGLTTLATSNVVASYNGGNATGGAALGGNGLTNVLYALDTGDALNGLSIITIPPVAPTITTAPVGGAFYASTTLSVVATGTTPFSYFWQASGSDTNTASSFTNITGANTNSLTITTGTNYYQVIITNVAGAVTSTPVQVTILQPVTNSAVSPLWKVSPGQSGYSWLSTSDGYERGIAYDTNSQQVVVAATTGLYIINGNTGVTNGTLNTNGATFGGLLPNAGIDQVGIGDDGAVYAGNLVNSGGAFALDQWSATTTNATANLAYYGDPAAGASPGDRWGDTMAVRGAGVNTQIAIASQFGTNVAIFTTQNGVNFNPVLIAISGVPAGFASGGGLAFGVGNTLWGKKLGGDLFEVSFDTNALTGSVIFDYAEPTEIGYWVCGVGIDPVNNILAGVNIGDSPNDLQLSQLTGTSDAPVLFDQAFFSSGNSNPNGSAAIVIKYPRVYALDANNGIVALTYGVPAATAPTIVTPPASQSVYANSPAGFSVQASGSLPLYYQWQFNGSNILNATSQTYTLTNAPLSAAGSYDVVVHNIAGAVTSAPPAVLTVVSPVASTNYVTNLWSLAAGSRPYLDTSSYLTRGMAYDTNYSYLYVCQTSGNIYVLNATNGSDAGSLNTGGLPTGGYSGFILDQVGVADDGVVYGANMAATANGNTFNIISWTPQDSTPADDSINYAYSPGDPGNGSGDRWGDDMAVRGAGTNTQMAFGSYSGSNVVLFTTQDGINFTPTLLTLSDTNVTPGFAGQGITFGAGNTLWTKGGHYFNLRQVAFNTTSQTLTVLQTFTAGTQTPNDFVGLSMDVKANVLGGVCLNDAPNDFQLYRVFGNSTPPALFNQAFFASQNANAQDNAVSTLKGGLGFALDVNNGLVALRYTAPPALAESFNIVGVTRVSGPGLNLSWQSVPGYTYQVQVATTLSKPTVWTNLGATIVATGTTTTYSDTSADAALSSGYYRVIGY